MSVVIVALSALELFAIPNEEFSAPFRLLKFGFIVLGGYFGIFGNRHGTVYADGPSGRSCELGIPYLMPFVGSDLTGYHDERDALVRAPFRMLKRRPIFSRRDQRVRMKKEES